MTDIDFKGLYQDEAVVEGVTGVPVGFPFRRS